jgi:uncharacterized protein (DUF1778 family)
MSGVLPYIVQMRSEVSQASNRTARIEARIAPEALATVKRAAELQGRSVSDFLVAAAQEAAQRTIEQAQIIRLSMADQEKIADLLAHPPAPNAALTRAYAAHRELIRDDQ